MLDHLRSLAVFATTVERGSFRAAARALSLSPSVVSHHVGELERRLGVVLLYRTTRKLSLTHDGEKLHRAAREMVGAAERGLDEIAGRSASPRGLLRLTAPALLAETSFSRDVAAFSHACPEVRLAISFSEMRHDLLRDGLDLALRIGTLEDSSLKARKLADMRRVLVAAPRYLADRPKPRAPEDLASWDLVQLSARPAAVTLVRLKRGAEPVTTAVAARVAVDSATAVRELVLAGVGIAQVPTVLARTHLERGRLVEVLPGWQVPAVGVYAVWPETGQRPALTLRFVDFIAPRIARLFAA